MLDSRNSVRGFSERVRKNLAFLNFARNLEADVHIVTELMTSLLGLIVFPVEEIKATGYNGFKTRALSTLEAEDWPHWKFVLGHSEDLHDLLFHLRNAISHRRVTFSSESRVLQEVHITFADRRPRQDQDYWAASINAEELKTFVLKLAELLDRIEKYE